MRLAAPGTVSIDKWAQQLVLVLLQVQVVVSCEDR